MLWRLRQSIFNLRPAWTNCIVDCLKTVAETLKQSYSVHLYLMGRKLAAKGGVRTLNANLPSVFLKFFKQWECLLQHCSKPQHYFNFRSPLKILNKYLMTKFWRRQFLLVALSRSYLLMIGTFGTSSSHGNQPIFCSKIWYSRFDWVENLKYICSTSNIVNMLYIFKLNSLIFWRILTCHNLFYRYQTTIKL